MVFDFSGPNTGLRYVAGYQDGALRIGLGHGTVRDAGGTLTYTGPWALHPRLVQIAGIEIVRAAAGGTTGSTARRGPVHMFMSLKPTRRPR